MSAGSVKSIAIVINKISTIINPCKPNHIAILEFISIPNNFIIS